MLAVRKLRKSYGGRAALAGFSLEVRPGEVVGLIGHNGAGKTTFVEIVTGLARADSGSARVCGVDALARPREARALLGVAPQELALYPGVTVREHLRLFAGLAGLRRSAAVRAVARTAADLMLTEVLDRRCGVLSGGQRRRTQAAAALVGNPPVLLLDEPTAGADPQTRTALLSAVRARAAVGAAVVYTTHYLPELVDLDATLAVVRGGRVVARGSRAELTADLPGEIHVTLDPALPRPDLPAPLAARTRLCGEDRLRIVTVNPPADLAALLACGCAPTAVDVRRPDLDTLYAALATSAGTSAVTSAGTEEASRAA